MSLVHKLLIVDAEERGRRMCGIVGLHLKNPGLQPRLGELLTQMLEAMTTRGPDSAGIAVYADRDPAPAGPGPGQPGQPGRQGQELRYSLRSDETIDWDLLAKRIAAETGRDLRVEPLGSDSAVFVSPAAETSFLAAVRRAAP
jgi:methylamine---glutamate N-methyltransferase subunit A